MRTRIILSALLIAFAAACAADEPEPPNVAATPIVGPGGGRAWSLECERRADCFWKAGRLCKFGYAIVDRTQETTATASQGVSYRGVSVGRTEEETLSTLTVECNR